MLALEGFRVGGEVDSDCGWDAFEKVGAVEGAFDQIAVGFASVVSEPGGYITRFRELTSKIFTTVPHA